MGPWLDSLNLWLTAHPQWLGLAIFTVAFIECLAVAGIVVPGTVVLFAVAVLAGGGALSLGETLLLAYAGGLLGDAVSYTLGRKCHNSIRRLPLLRTHPEWIGTAETYFHRYGIASLLVGRFIGPLRPMLPMIAGMFEMPLLRFIAVSMVAAAGWSVAYMLPGWATGAAMRLPLPEGFWPEAGVVAAGFAVLLGVSVHVSWRGHPKSTLIVSLASLAMLAGLFFGWPLLNHLDQGLMTLIQENRHTGVDGYVVMVTRMGDFRNQLIAAVLLTCLLLLTRQWRHALFAGGAMLCTALANGALKGWFARIRPEVLSEPLTTFSMPSGHSSAAFAFFLCMAVLAGRGQPPRMRLTWLVLAGLPALSIALSRVYLGVHWPTDIMAGAMLACAVCAASLTLIEWRQPLPALPLRVWWVILPLVLALLAFSMFYALPGALERYHYPVPN